MPVAIALIRGINVGGNNIVPMADLRALCEGLGLEAVRTYIQSGNVVFKSPTTRLKRVATDVEAEIEARRGFRPRVFVRTLEQWRSVIQDNPFAGRPGIDKSRLLFMFLDKAPPPDAVSAISALSSDREEARLVGREVYLHIPDGVAKSKLSSSVIERVLKAQGTCRNLLSVEKLLSMSEELESIAS